MKPSGLLKTMMAGASLYGTLPRLLPNRPVSHLLETRQWDAARDKIEQVLQSLKPHSLGRRRCMKCFIGCECLYVPGS